MALSKTKTYGVAGASLCGAVMLGMMAGPGIASAQDEEADSESTTTDESVESEESSKSRKGNKRGFKNSEALEELGLTSELIQEGRQEGLSLAEVAEAQGVAVDDVVSAIVDSIVTRAEENGRDLEKTEAEITEKVTERVTSVKSESRGKAAFLDDATKEEVKEAVEAQDYDTAKALMSDAVDAALEAGDIDAERAEELQAKIADKDFSEKQGRRGHKGNRGSTVTETAA